MWQARSEEGGDNSPQLEDVFLLFLFFYLPTGTSHPPLKKILHDNGYGSELCCIIGTVMYTLWVLILVMENFGIVRDKISE